MQVSAKCAILLYGDKPPVYFFGCKASERLGMNNREPTMFNLRAQQVLAASGIVFFVILLINFIVIMDFIPPLSPSMTAEEVAIIYTQNSVPIRIGCVILMFFAFLGLTWSAAVSAQMRRIDTANSALADVNSINGSWSFGLFTFPALFWALASFRPETRDPELTYLLSDLGWIAVVMPVASAVIQGLSIGTVILSDRRERPIYPRWWGYVNLWIAVLFIPGGLAVLFKTGPFAWNGLFVFYIPLTIFGVWIVGNSIFTLIALRRQINEEAG
jgi:hypothetical protein